MNLTSHVVLYNTEKILYPWRECIQSIAPISEEILVNICHDEEYEIDTLMRWAADQDFRDKMRFIAGSWGTKAECIAELTNQCIDAVATKWHLCIQADEVLHEDSYKEIEWFTKQSGFPAARLKYQHFVGDFDTTFPFIYPSAIRIALTDSAWRSAGDGMELLGGAGHTWLGRMYMCHYGKVSLGREKEAVNKERSFQDMFLHLNKGFPDPKVVAGYEAGGIDYKHVFETSSSEFSVFHGKHPKVVLPYIERLKKRANLPPTDL